MPIFAFRGIFTYRCFQPSTAQVYLFFPGTPRMVNSCCALGAWSGAMPYVHVRGIGTRTEGKTFVESRLTPLSVIQYSMRSIAKLD